MKRAVVLMLALAVTACSPKGTVIPSDPAHWDQLGEKAKHLSESDRRLLTAYLLRQGVAGVLSGGKPSVPAGTTIGQAITDQKKFEDDAAKREAEAEALKAKAAAQQAAAEAALDNTALVTLVSKTFAPQNVEAGRFSDHVRFVIAIQNKSTKDIAGIRGVLQFNDMFGAEIKSVRLSFDEGVKAGKIFTSSSYGLDLNQFDDGDTKLGQTDLSKMKVIFHPQMVVFADGSKMEAPTGATSQ